MDDNAKNTCSYQLDQDLLDERGINMTVDEVAGLSTSKYSERVQSLKLCDEDLAFLKSLRRRIKNRLASQNSRRRSVEHLRRLTRELRAVRACRRDALSERRALVARRDLARDKCAALRRHLLRILHERSDSTEVPSIEIESQPKETTTIPTNHHISVIVKNNIDNDKLRQELEKEEDIYERVRKELQKEIQNETVIIDSKIRETLIIKGENPDYEEMTTDDNFESTHCQDSQLNQKRNENFSQRKSCEDCSQRSCEDCSQSCSDEMDKSCDEMDKSCDGMEKSCKVFGQFKDYESSDEEPKNLICSESSDRDIFECKIGKLVTQSVNHMFNDKKKIFAKTVFISNEKLSSDIKTMVLGEGNEENGVLNLSVKEGRRKSHGRKQSAPRRIAYYNDCDDVVLDLKVKKEPQ